MLRCKLIPSMLMRTCSFLGSMEERFDLKARQWKDYLATSKAQANKPRKWRAGGILG